jgi:hypothetical protein
MPKSNPLDGKTKEKLNKFLVDISLVIVGLFLALGFQGIIQFVELIVPHITPYFFLALGVGSLLMVLVFMNRAARYAGLDKRNLQSAP